MIPLENEYVPLELKPFDVDRITDAFSNGIPLAVVAIISAGLLGFTISKLFNFMKG